MLQLASCSSPPPPPVYYIYTLYYLSLSFPPFSLPRFHSSAVNLQPIILKASAFRIANITKYSRHRYMYGMCKTIAVYVGMQRVESSRFYLHAV